MGHGWRKNPVCSRLAAEKPLAMLHPKPSSVTVRLIDEPWETLLGVDPAPVTSVRISTSEPPTKEGLLWLRRCGSLQRLQLDLPIASTITLTSPQLQLIHVTGRVATRFGNETDPSRYVPLAIEPQCLPGLHTLVLDLSCGGVRYTADLRALLARTPNLQRLALNRLTSRTALPPLPKLSTLTLLDMDFFPSASAECVPFVCPPALTGLNIMMAPQSRPGLIDYDSLCDCRLQTLELSIAGSRHCIAAASLYKACHASSKTLERLVIHSNVFDEVDEVVNAVDVVTLLRGCHRLQHVVLQLYVIDSTDQLGMCYYPHLTTLHVRNNCSGRWRMKVPVNPWVWSLTSFLLLHSEPDAWTAWSAIITRNRQLVATSKWLTLALWNRRLPADQRLPREACRLVFSFAG